MTTIAAPLPRIPSSAPALRGCPERLQLAGDQLWRVVDRSGFIRGHVRRVSDPLGVRYRAERLRGSTATFYLVGEFWAVEDAVAALRH